MPEDKRKAVALALAEELQSRHLQPEADRTEYGGS
jgi:hypothetical protein